MTAEVAAHQEDGVVIVQEVVEDIIGQDPDREVEAEGVVEIIVNRQGHLIQVVREDAHEVIRGEDIQGKGLQVIAENHITVVRGVAIGSHIKSPLQGGIRRLESVQGTVVPILPHQHHPHRPRPAAHQVLAILRHPRRKLGQRKSQFLRRNLNRQ